jgi:UPF0716 protein FxsA
MGADGGARMYRDDDVIEGEFTDVTSGKRPTHKPVQGPSGWTKH